MQRARVGPLSRRGTGCPAPAFPYAQNRNLLILPGNRAYSRIKAHYRTPRIRGCLHRQVRAKLRRKSERWQDLDDAAILAIVAQGERE
jgi:hypothetical protein